MSARKPKAVVLGKGKLYLSAISAGIERSGHSITFYRHVQHIGEPGALLWQPEPPKPKKAKR